MRRSVGEILRETLDARAIDPQAPPQSQEPTANVRSRSTDLGAGAEQWLPEGTVPIATTDQWLPAARQLREHPELAMDHWIDLTAVDYPQRGDRRFDLLLFVRSSTLGRRAALCLRLSETDCVPSLTSVWEGAVWAEREVYDMFGIAFAGHPDLRRILLYEEFVGHPLRKDYPIEGVQPLVPYRKAPDIHKLPPFGADEGQPWTRVQWKERLLGKDRHVSPAIAWQQGQREALHVREDAEAERHAGQSEQEGSDEEALRNGSSFGDSHPAHIAGDSAR